jgi:hypothetical protein
MGTQTGEQRVTVMGAAVSASGVRLERIAVTVLDDEGALIGTAETDSKGEYAVEVATAGGLTVEFTTPTGQTASAAVDVASKTSVTVNLVVPLNGKPIIVVPVPTPTPSPTAGTPLLSTPTPSPGQPTATPVPPPVGQTPTPVPTSTPAPVPTAPIYTPPPDDGSVCEIDSGVDAEGEPPVVCCTDQQVAEEGCCNDYFRNKGLC